MTIQTMFEHKSTYARIAERNYKTLGIPKGKAISLPKATSFALIQLGITAQQPLLHNALHSSGGLEKW